MLASCPPGATFSAFLRRSAAGGTAWGQPMAVAASVGDHRGMVTCHPIGPHLDTAALHSGLQAGMSV